MFLVFFLHLDRHLHLFIRVLQRLLVLLVLMLLVLVLMLLMLLVLLMILMRMHLRLKLQLPPERHAHHPPREVLHPLRMRQVGLGARIQPPHLGRKRVLPLQLLRAQLVCLAHTHTHTHTHTRTRCRANANASTSTSLRQEIGKGARRNARDGRERWQVLAMCVGEACRVKVREGGRGYDRECALALKLASAFAFVLVFVNCAHDGGWNARVAPAVRTPKAEARADETRIGSDAARGRKHLFLAERVRLVLLLLLLLLISILLIQVPALKLLLQRWWLTFWGRTSLLDLCKPRSGARGRVRWAHPQSGREKARVHPRRSLGIRWAARTGRTRQHIARVCRIPPRIPIARRGPDRAHASRTRSGAARISRRRRAARVRTSDARARGRAPGKTRAALAAPCRSRAGRGRRGRRGGDRRGAVAVVLGVRVRGEVHKAELGVLGRRKLGG